MGCDIHGYAEVLTSVGLWAERERIPDTRNYSLFAALANVRNGLMVIRDGNYINVAYLAERRGFPEGCSDRSAEWNSDNHSASWTTPEEILSWDGWEQVLRYQEGLLLREACLEFIEWCEALQAKYGDRKCRIVFWFDN